MSALPSHSRGGKVTVLSTGEVQLVASTAGPSTSAAATAAAAAARASSASGAADKEPKRKVGTSFERSFAVPQGQGQEQPGPSGSRPVLKAGKAVSSAPPGPSQQQRPLTDLEKAFASRPVQDQRWLLSFPMALKQLYFGFAESPNHENLLAGLIRRFPELLAGGGGGSGSDQSATPSPIQVAVERGNWTPVLHFVKACAGGQHTRLLQRRCGLESGTTLLILAIESFVRGLQSAEPSSSPADALGRKAICDLAQASPDLAEAADSAGRNPLHHWAQHLQSQPLQRQPALLALLRDLRATSEESPDLARHLGNALVARDASGCQPIDLVVAAEATEARHALSQWLQELAASQQAAMEVSAGRESLSSALTQRGKSEEFVQRVTQRLGSKIHQLRLLSAGTVDDPVRAALDWVGEADRPELRLALADIGQADLCHLV